MTTETTKQSKAKQIKAMVGVYLACHKLCFIDADSFFAVWFRFVDLQFLAKVDRDLRKKRKQTKPVQQKKNSKKNQSISVYKLIFSFA